MRSYNNIIIGWVIYVTGFIFHQGPHIHTACVHAFLDVHQSNCFPTCVYIKWIHTTAIHRLSNSRGYPVIVIKAAYLIEWRESGHTYNELDCRYCHICTYYISSLSVRFTECCMSITPALQLCIYSPFNITNMYLNFHCFFSLTHRIQGVYKYKD